MYIPRRLYCVTLGNHHSGEIPCIRAYATPKFNHVSQLPVDISQVPYRVRDIPKMDLFNFSTRKVGRDYRELSDIIYDDSKFNFGRGDSAAVIDRGGWTGESSGSNSCQTLARYYGSL